MEKKKKMNREFNISNVKFKIRHETPKTFNRVSCRKIKNNKYNITITSVEACDTDPLIVSGWLNHECLHIILSEFISCNVSSLYDNLLINFDHYYIEDVVLEMI